MGAVDRADLRAAILYGIGQAAPAGLTLAVLVASLRDVEPTGIKKHEVAEAIDTLVGEGSIHATGSAPHGTRRFHPGRAHP